MVKLSAIAQELGLKFYGEDVEITSANTLQDASACQISFFSNAKYKAELLKTSAGAVITSNHNADLAPQGVPVLIAENTYYTWSCVLKILYNDKYSVLRKATGPSISESAYISTSATIGKEVTIARNAVIEDDAEIGDGCTIGVGCVIAKGVKIGNNTYIAPNCTIQAATIGENCIIHPGVAIGQEGFGFAFHNGVHNKVMQIGNVQIGDDVEIGANSSIDCAAITSTTIGSGTKIDNQVQIGHGVQIGKCCIIVAQVGIAGSTVLEDYVVVGGKVGIAGHLHIGMGAQIAGGSVVIKSLSAGKKYGGHPAVELGKWHRQVLTLQKMVAKQ